MRRLDFQRWVSAVRIGWKSGLVYGRILRTKTIKSESYWKEMVTTKNMSESSIPLTFFWQVAELHQTLGKSQARIESNQTKQTNQILWHFWERPASFDSFIPVLRFFFSACFNSRVSAFYCLCKLTLWPGIYRNAWGTFTSSGNSKGLSRFIHLLGLLQVTKMISAENPSSFARSDSFRVLRSKPNYCQQNFTPFRSLKLLSFSIKKKPT